MEGMLSGVRRQLGARAPRFGAYFNCASRNMNLYQERGVDSGLINEFFPTLPVSGFTTGFEMAPIGASNYLHLYSGTLLLVAEEP